MLVIVGCVRQLVVNTSTSTPKPRLFHTNKSVEKEKNTRPFTGNIHTPVRLGCVTKVNGACRARVVRAGSSAAELAPGRLRLALHKICTRRNAPALRHRQSEPRHSPCRLRAFERTLPPAGGAHTPHLTRRCSWLGCTWSNGRIAWSGLLSIADTDADRHEERDGCSHICSFRCGRPAPPAIAGRVRREAHADNGAHWATLLWSKLALLPGLGHGAHPWEWNAVDAAQDAGRSALLWACRHVRLLWGFPRGGRGLAWAAAVAEQSQARPTRCMGQRAVFLAVCRPALLQLCN